ncbi:MAG: methyltransferase domain-containing protein [Thermodesulfobacteriota bacterium]
MFLKTIQDVVCPSFRGGGPCSGALELDRRLAPEVSGAENGDVREGLLRCTICGKEYPVICGVLILVGNIDSYLAQNYTGILGLGAEEGIGRRMIDYLKGRGSDLKDASYSGCLWDNSTAGTNLYLSVHYDRISDLVGEGHPLQGFLRSYCDDDFYSRMGRLIAPVLGESVLALDVGCNVGGSAYRLARTCRFVYGIDFSFRFVLAARRVLLGSPVPQESYRLHRERLVSEPRPLSVKRLGNAEFFVASGLNLPFPDGSFDFVNCQNLIDVVGQPKDLIRENLRAAGPGKHILFTDPFHPGLEVGGAVVESRLGYGSQDASSASLRRFLEDESCRIVAEADEVPWVIRVHDRCFQIWLNHCILAQKRVGGV